VKYITVTKEIGSSVNERYDPWVADQFALFPGECGNPLKIQLKMLKSASVRDFKGAGRECNSLVEYLPSKCKTLVLFWFLSTKKKNHTHTHTHIYIYFFFFLFSL
jgi:hypothetical protein